jgi:F-type H+-transporting ATPase subunit b
MLTAQLGAAAAHASSLPAGMLAMSGGGVRIDIDLPSVAVQMVVFATLILLLKPLLFDPVLRVFEEREKRTDGARNEARRMQEEAGELLQQYERALDRVRQVASEERERLRAETAELEAEILQSAQQAVAQTLEEGRQRIEKETGTLRSELGRESERIAAEMAARVLGRELS